jgi:ArsR family transcriptional regulator
VDTGRQRLSHVPNLRFVCADMHDLPFEDRSFDTVLLMSALDLAERPPRVIRECARVLAAGGALVGVTLAAHRHTAAVAPYNHVQMGFAPDRLRRMLEHEGFAVDLCAVTSRERRPPHFEVVTLHARRS